MYLNTYKYRAKIYRYIRIHTLSFAKLATREHPHPFNHHKSSQKTTTLVMARPKNDGRGRLGGRAKGTPNRVTATLRQVLANTWQQYYDSGQFQADIQALDPATRASVMEKYAQYFAPRMKSIDISGTLDATAHATIEDRLRKLCNPDDNPD